MDSLGPAGSDLASSAAPALAIPIQRPPRIWKFWGTALWGLFVFAAMYGAVDFATADIRGLLERALP